MADRLDPPPKPALGVNGIYPCIVWNPIRCPKCGSLNATGKGVKKSGLRYHQCADCGTRFKSKEAPPPPTAENDSDKVHCVDS